MGAKIKVKNFIILLFDLLNGNIDFSKVFFFLVGFYLQNYGTKLKNLFFVPSYNTNYNFTSFFSRNYHLSYIRWFFFVSLYVLKYNVRVTLNSTVNYLQFYYNQTVISVIYLSCNYYYSLYCCYNVLKGSYPFINK